VQGRPAAAADDSGLRFHIAVQRSRFAVIALMGAVAAVGRLTGLVHFDIPWAIAAYATGLASTFVFSALHRRAARTGSRFPLHYAWMALDVLLSCWTIWLIRDEYPLWLIWFLATASAAAFVAGRRAAQVVIAGSSIAYLLLLVALGEIAGFDRGLALALGRLTLLFGVTYFMIRGIADLREKRMQIAALSAETAARVDELQRLTQELDRRGRELAEANRRGVEANRAKSQFLANMSHELRTPLNSIIGFSEILTEKLEGRIEPRLEKFLANIVGSGRHLLSLINDILDLSKIEAGRMELTFEPMSIGDAIHGVASVMHGVAERRGVSIVLALPVDLPTIVADPPRVKQVLYNLLSNAVKFSGAGGAIEVRARELPAEDSPLGVAGLEVEVEDHGVGIRSEDQQLIFEEFRQVDGDTTRNMGGTGLGLALVKRFTEMHGGRVEVESEVGRGSTFRLLLPVDAAGAPARRVAGDPVSFGFPVAATRAALDSEAPTILVAEDDDEFFRSLAGDLEAAGYRVVRARDGEAALALARADPPAAITLDLVLPVRDGWEVLKELKADPGTARLPVVIVSLVANHELGFALGAADYFVKPLDREPFLERLRELVPPAGAARPLVLVVDDDPQVHDYLAFELADAGFEMLSAGDGAEGVRLAAERRPAVIVLDLLMDGVDGFQAAAELTRRVETAAIPIVVFTSKELEAAERAALSGRIAALLSKAPDDRRRLVATIRDLEARGRRAVEAPS
jgi:signal transduction histidine kinase/DNA-binding response OmpR family regulator